MDPITIIALVTAVEQLIASTYKVINEAGLSKDDTDAYIARIVNAQNSVPEPKVGE